MKSFVLTLFAVLVTIYAHANNRNLDSLFDVKGLELKQAEERCTHLGYLANTFPGSTDSARIILRRAYKMATLYNSDLMRMTLKTASVVILLREKKYAEAYNLAINASLWGDTTSNKNIKYLSRDPLLNFYRHFGNLKEKIKVRQTKLKLAFELGDSVEISKVSYNLAYDLFQAKIYPESRKLFLQAYRYLFL